MVFLELQRDSRVTTGNSGCLLCWPNALEKEMGTHSCVLAWRIPETGESGGLSVGCRLWGHTESDTTEATQQQQQQSPILPFITGEGNGNPLQYSCLENPMDRAAWWAMVHGVA